MGPMTLCRDNESNTPLVVAKQYAASLGHTALAVAQRKSLLVSFPPLIFICLNSAGNLAYSEVVSTYNTKYIRDI